MATSGAYTVTTTAGTLCSDILLSLGALAVGDTADTNSLNIVIRRMNYWIMQMKGPPNFLNPGEKMWLRETADLTLSAKVKYSLKPSGGDLAIQIPSEILSANLKTTDGDETPLVPMTLEEYQAIGSKGETGTPTSYYAERRTDEMAIYLDYIPSDTTDVIDIVYRQPIEIISSSSNDLDFENQWYRALLYNVAVDCATIWPVDAAQMNLLSNLARESLMIVSTFDPQNSSDYFQPGLE